MLWEQKVKKQQLHVLPHNLKLLPGGSGLSGAKSSTSMVGGRVMEEIGKNRSIWQESSIALSMCVILCGGWKQRGAVSEIAVQHLLPYLKYLGT